MSRVEVVPVCMLLVMSGALAAPASAQNTPYALPSDTMAVSPGGVDLHTGRYAFDVQDLSIAMESIGGLELHRTTSATKLYSTNNAFAQYESSLRPKLTQTKVCKNCTSAYVAVTFGAISYNFNASKNNVTLASSSSYARLDGVFDGVGHVTYTLVTVEGVKIRFPQIDFPDGTNLVSTTISALPTSAQYPNGLSLAYTYNNAYTKIVNNAGYGILLEYTTSPRYIARACAVNLSRLVLGTTCPAAVQTVNYQYTGNFLSSVTDRVGAIWRYTSTFTDFFTSFTESFFKPGDSTPYLINTYSNDLPSEGSTVATQDFSDGRHYKYDYHYETYFYQAEQGGQPEKEKDQWVGDGWTLTNAAAPNISLKTAVTFGAYSLPPIITPTPMQVIDPAGHRFTWDYKPPAYWLNGALVQGRAMPEGNREAYTYDSYRNVTQTDRYPKPGSVEAQANMVVTTRSEFGNCTAFVDLVACNKPTATIDARQNRTEYVYDPVHGGVVRETQPLDSSGIAPVKRTNYVKRFAWLASASGGYARSSTGIWLKSEERTCRKSATLAGSAGCTDGSADEVVTSYEYGPDAGPNTLLLRGVAVTADGQTLRTCYAYDDYGRKISETKPLGTASLQACP